MQMTNKEMLELSCNELTDSLKDVVVELGQCTDNINSQSIKDIEILSCVSDRVAHTLKNVHKVHSSLESGQSESTSVSSAKFDKTLDRVQKKLMRFPMSTKSAMNIDSHKVIASHIEKMEMAHTEMKTHSGSHYYEKYIENLTDLITVLVFHQDEMTCK